MSESSIKITRLRYNQQELPPYQLLDYSDGYLASLINLDGFNRLQRQIGIPLGRVLDIGASRNVIRAVALLDATNTICVDPAYAFYEDVEGQGYGGRDEKADMVEGLKQAFSQVSLPFQVSKDGATLIEGVRLKRQRKIELVPKSITDWLKTESLNTFNAVIAWRTFLNDNLWAQIISGLPIGTILVTTGYGISTHGKSLSSHIDSDVVSSGVDINNSPLPQNGKVEQIGLTALTNLSDIYFYKKTQQINLKQIEKRLKENRRTFFKIKQIRR